MEMRWIRSRSRRLLFLLVLFQLPIFRVACRSGECESPLHVMLGQVQTSLPVSNNVLAALLFPGALLRNARLALTQHVPFAPPSLSAVVVEYNLTTTQPPSTAHSGSLSDADEESPQPDPLVFRLEVVVGSYLLVGGAVESLLKPGRFAFLGSLVIGWGWIKHNVLDPRLGASSPSGSGSDPAAYLELYPSYFLVLALALLSLPVKFGSGRTATPAVSGLKIARKKQQ